MNQEEQRYYKKLIEGNPISDADRKDVLTKLKVYNSHGAYEYSIDLTKNKEDIIKAEQKFIRMHKSRELSRY